MSDGGKATILTGHPSDICYTQGNMKTLKVNELDGPYLSYWAARASGEPADQVAVIDRKVCVVSDGDWPLNGFRGRHIVDYCESFSLFGELIEEYGICLQSPDVMPFAPHPGRWYAGIPSMDRPVAMVDNYGPTARIAAMRALVAMVYGPEVPEFVVWPKGGTETAPDGVPA